MSGHLARLAARATGSGPALAPRLPALFEPVEGVAPSLSPDAGIESTAPHDPVPPLPVAAVARADSARAVPEPPATASLPPASRAVAVTPPSRQMQGAAPRFVELSPRIAAARHEPADGAPAPATTTRVATDMPPKPAPPSPHVIQPASVRAADRERPRISVIPAQAELRSELRSRSLDPGLRRDDGQGRGHARLPAAPSPAAANRTHVPYPVTPETVVQVSIGRIEVRAAPAAPASVPRAEGPRASRIDEYLRQRAGRDAP